MGILVWSLEWRLNRIVLKIEKVRIRFGSSLGINNWWSYGSSTAVYIVCQVMTGVVLSIYVIILTRASFTIVELFVENSSGGHFLRFLHANFCSLVFIVMLIHLRKGLWILSFSKVKLWISGTVMLMLVIGAAFLGYVLPWRNMSLWRATVITNLLSVLPYGDVVLLNVWARFSISNATLGRFFSLHYLLPLIVTRLILMHLLMLHDYLSNSGIRSNIAMVSFSVVLNKDVIFWGIIILVLVIIMCSPQYFMDADNWREANYLVTPDHIKPEWYFLFAYAILRCIPNKTIGVLGLVGSLILVLMIGVRNLLMLITYFVMNFWILTWLGGLDVVEYYTVASQIGSIVYVIIIL